MNAIITSPSLNTRHNVSGISSVANFIINNNKSVQYTHFELGKRDDERRNIFWFLRIIRTYFKWIRLLFKNFGSTIHFNITIDKNAVIRDFPLIIIAKTFCKHFVLHLHGGQFLLHNNVPRWMKVLIKIIVHGNNPKIVLSNKEAETLVSRYKCKKVFILPNCIDLREAKMFERNGEPEILKILFLGRIEKNKGLEYMYQAFSTLRNEGVFFEFYLAGKGPDEAEYLEKFSNVLGDSFNFQGVVSGERKTGLLKNCNVFLLPSFFEGLPIALLESMAFGLIPIATPVGSIKNIITDGSNGLLVKVKSSNDIALAIKKLANDIQIRKDLSDKSREHIFIKYNPQVYISTLNTIYSNE